MLILSSGIAGLLAGVQIKQALLLDTTGLRVCCIMSDTTFCDVFKKDPCLSSICAVRRSACQTLVKMAQQVCDLGGPGQKFTCASVPTTYVVYKQECRLSLPDRRFQQG